MSSELVKLRRKNGQDIIKGVEHGVPVYRMVFQSTLLLSFQEEQLPMPDFDIVSFVDHGLKSNGLRVLEEY